MKFIPIRKGFAIKKDEIIGIEDISDGNTFLTKIHTKGGQTYQTGINYKALVGLMEENDSINQFTQHSVG